MSTCILRSLAAVACAASLLHADVLTVDDDGPADFATLVDAVGAAGSGDVILVAPGNYPTSTITIDKSLAILGRDVATSSLTQSTVVVTSTVGSLTLAGLRGFDLDVVGTPGRVRIDDCHTRWVDTVGAAQVLVTGSLCNPASGNVFDVERSVVAIADSALDGPSDSEEGYIGLRVDPPGPGPRQFSDVIVSGTRVLGGSADTSPFLPGQGGDAIFVGSAGTGHPNVVDVRGSSDDWILGGLGFYEGESINGPHTHSGVTVDPPVGEGLVHPPEPHLRVLGHSVLGGSNHVEMYGIEGQPAVVLFSILASPPIRIPGWKGKLWQNLQGLVLTKLLLLEGQDVAAAFDVPVPDVPQLLGLAVDVQGLVLMPDGTLHLTNPEQVVTREP